MATSHDGYVPVASLEVTAVRPTPSGFQLHGLGADAAEYLMDLHLDMPIDQRTRTVLGEMFSQSEWEIFRRVQQPLKTRVQRTRAASER